MTDAAIRNETIVLKFGGSVLTHPSELKAVVGEILHEVRRQRSVVAVVSPLFGTERKLLSQAGRAADAPAGPALAKLIATAGQQSAALLGLALSDSGVAHTLMSAREARYVAQGPAEDAEPASIDTMALQSALNRAPVVVLSGLEAINDRGQSVLISRGRADLTAVFIAEALGADVRLVKDVDGVFDRDPAASAGIGGVGVGSTPRRFTTLSWDDALAACGPVVKPRALELAVRRHVRVRIGGLCSSGGTLICERTELEAGAAAGQGREVAKV